MSGNDYYQFNFARFKPKNLERLAKNISVDSLIVKPDFDKLQRLMEKLKSEDIELRTSEIKFLCFFVKSIKNEGLFGNLLNVCHNCFNKETKVLYHVKGLLSSYYDDFDDNKLYKLLQHAVIRNSVWKESLIPVKLLVLNSKESLSFNQALYEQFQGCKSFAEINIVKENLLIDDNHLIYQRILLIILQDKISRIHSYEDFTIIREIVNYFKDLNLIKPAIERFLLAQDSRLYFDDLPGYLENMFNLIGEKLGDVYGPTRNRWQGINEPAKRVFILWRTQKQIKHFFGEIMGDPARLNFWQSYSHYFRRIEPLEKYDGAFLMETDQHLFIEFADMGAMHMYSIKELSIDQVQRNSKIYGKTKMISMFLKNKSIAITYLGHRGSWQWSFEWELKKRGYEMRR